MLPGTPWPGESAIVCPKLPHPAMEGSACVPALTEGWDDTFRLAAFSVSGGGRRAHRSRPADPDGAAATFAGPIGIWFVRGLWKDTCGEGRIGAVKALSMPVVPCGVEAGRGVPCMPFQLDVVGDWYSVALFCEGFRKGVQGG